MRTWLLGLQVGLLALASVLPAAHSQAAQLHPVTPSSVNPGVVASTYLGGTATDYGRAVALDAQGNIYVAGDTFSKSMFGLDFPNQGAQDILVLKLSPDGKTLLDGVTIGSTSTDRVGSMAVTPQGEVVLLKINAAFDSLVFSTYTPFTVDVGLENIGVDATGKITVTGYTYTATNRARDLTVQTYSADGQSVLFEKTWGGDLINERAQAIVVRPDGTTTIAGYVEGLQSDLPVTDNAVQKLCGRKKALGTDRECDDDGFVMTLDPTGTLIYASYLGGNGSDRIVGLAVDGAGAIYASGATYAVDFPTTASAFEPQCPRAKPEDGCYYDTFVAKISPAGNALVYSTYLTSEEFGGLEYPADIAVDTQGNATVVNWTASDRFPVKNAIQSALNATPCPNAFQDRLCFDTTITTFDTNGQLVFSSYFGGAFDEVPGSVVAGPDGSLYLTGTTESPDYPATSGALQPDARSGSDMFLTRVNLNANSQPGPGPQPQPGALKVYLPLTRG